MPDLNDKIATASAAASEEYEKANTPEVKAEPTPEPKVEPKAEPAAEPAAEAKPDVKAEAKTEENPLNLTKEDLEAIEADPLLRKAYKTVLRGFTSKTTELAKERKQHEEDLNLLQWFRNDPDNALKALARARGFDLGPPKGEAAKVVDKIQEKMDKTFGPEGAKALRPIFEDLVQTMVDERIKPAAERVDQLEHIATETGVENVVQTFIAELATGDEEYNEEIQSEMAKLAVRLRKANDVPLKDHLRSLYNSVMHEREQKSRVSADLKRLQEARKKTEPIAGVRPTSPVERKMTADMTLNEKVALAVEMARNRQ